MKQPPAPITVALMFRSAHEAQKMAHRGMFAGGMRKHGVVPVRVSKRRFIKYNASA